MRKIFLILLLFFHTIKAVEVTFDELWTDSYFIKLGIYKNSNSVERIKKKFSSDKIYINNYKNLKAIYMVNFPTKESADKKFDEVLKVVKDAYILKTVGSIEYDIPFVEENKIIMLQDSSLITDSLVKDVQENKQTFVFEEKSPNHPDYDRAFFVEKQEQNSSVEIGIDDKIIITEDNNTDILENIKIDNNKTVLQDIQTINNNKQIINQEDNTTVIQEIELDNNKTVLQDIQTINDNRQIINQEDNTTIVEEIKLDNNITVLQDITKEDNSTKIAENIDINKTNTILPDINKSIKSGLTLQEAVLIALNKNNKILAHREKVIQAKRKLDEAKAAFQPKATLYSNLSTNYIKQKTKNKELYEKGDVQLSITQNLYSGGKDINTFKKEQMKLESALLKFKTEVEKEAITIIEAYLSVIYEKESISINRNNMKNLKDILKIVTIKEENGAATKGDLNYIKSNVENASSALVKSESKFSNAIAFYKYYVGDIEDGNAPIEKDFNITLQDLNTTIKDMQNSNTSLKMTQFEIEAERYNYQSKNGVFKPKIDLIVTAKDKRGNSEAEPQYEDKASATLALNYNFYNGGKDQAIKLGVKSKIAALKYKLNDLRDGAKFNTIQLYGNTTSAKDSLIHTQNEVKANLKVVESYWNAFKYGTQDLQALLLGQRALTRSQLDEITQKQTYTQNYFKLLEQMGELVNYLHINDFVNADKIDQEQ